MSVLNKQNSISITVQKADAQYDLKASKFFGAPVIPQSWFQSFYEDEIFLCQIRLSDIAELDIENRLPHTGYLYVFLRADDGNYNLRADVRYYNGEPNMVIDDFNLAVSEYEKFNTAWLMHFDISDEMHNGTKLLGLPSDWNYEEEPPKLLMQYDPLDNDMGFLDFLDGYLYLFFGDNVNDFDSITLKEEFS